MNPMMRRIPGVAIPLAIVLAGCQGDPVGTPATDAADTGSGDVALDTGAADAGGETPADAGACVASSANLIPNGDFADDLAGWQLTNTGGAIATDEVAPPCGKAVHLTASKLYGAMSREVKRAFAKGTRVRLRGWFKQRAGSKGDTPAYFGQFLHSVDGGSPVTTEEVWVRSVLESGWTLVEATKTLEQDEASVTIVVSSTRGDGKDDDYAVAGLSLVLE